MVRKVFFHWLLKSLSGYHFWYITLCGINLIFFIPKRERMGARQIVWECWDVKFLRVWGGTPNRQLENVPPLVKDPKYVTGFQYLKHENKPNHSSSHQHSYNTLRKLRISRIVTTTIISRILMNILFRGLRMIFLEFSFQFSISNIEYKFFPCFRRPVLVYHSLFVW